MSKGRKFTTFKIKVNDGTEYEVPVKVVTHDDDSKSFTAEHEETGVRAEDDDINALKATITKKIQEAHVVDWKLYIYTQVQKKQFSMSGETPTVVVEFKYDYYILSANASGPVSMRVPAPKGEARAQGKWDGNRFSGFGGKTSPIRGLPQVGDLEDRFSGGGWGVKKDPTITASLIPATPENIAAVEAFSAMLLEVADKIRKAFHPDNVEKLLASRSLNVGLLASGEK